LKRLRLPTHQRTSTTRLRSMRSEAVTVCGGAPF
jgi:hypothetical protein